MPKINADSGFLAILNQDADAIIRGGMTALEHQMIMFLHRYTRGFQRNAYSFKVRWAAELMGANKSSVYKVLRKLEARGVIRLKKGREKITIELRGSSLITPWGSGPQATHSGQEATHSGPQATHSGPQATAHPYSQKQNRKKKEGKENGREYEVLEIFNRFTGKQVPMNPLIKAAINARLSEGFTDAEFERAVRNINATWGQDQEMCGNVTPKSVYGQRMGEYVHMLTPQQLASKEGRYDEVDF